MFMKRVQLLDEIRVQAAQLAIRKKEILSFKYLRKAMSKKHVSQFEISRHAHRKSYLVN